MSKKKVASRSAMTLKDFHGGSIPSDLPLPSAPGMTVDRSVFERQGSATWMSPTLGRGYGNDRSGYHRHGQSNGVRTFEDKSSYFPNPANIGRNYDEDERKPVDGRPRSSHSADRFDDHGYEERRGGYSMDRYSLEDQGGLGSVPSFSEAKSSSASDRFPPSQVLGNAFHSDIYVHDEFGLIPVGPPPSQVLPQEPQPRQKTMSFHRELSEQPSNGQSQQMPSMPYLARQQTATSPSRSWRNPLHHTQSATSAPALPQESSTNVWTARRDGDSHRMPTSEPPSSESFGSSTSRSHGMAGKLLETRAVDKVASGRWLSDVSRSTAVSERLLQFTGPVSEQVRESVEHHKPYGADYPGDNVRGPYASDVNAARYSAEFPGGVPKSDFCRVQQSAEGIQGTCKQAVYSQSGRGIGSDARLRESSDTDGLVEQQGERYRVDTGRQSYSEEERWSSSGGFSETDRSSSNIDTERIGRSDSYRGLIDSNLSNADSFRVSHVDSIRGPEGGRAEPIDPNRVGLGSSSSISTTDDIIPAGFGDGKRRWGPSSVDRADSYDKVWSSASEGWRAGLSSTDPARIESTGPAASGEQAEVLERPKLKLLPRSKPLEKVDAYNVTESENVADYEEGSSNIYSQSNDKGAPEGLSVRPVLKELGTANDETEEEGNRKVSRPKLNLKPRSQPADAESEEGSQKVRQLLFGGARPRELVLKDRGVDDPLGGALDVVQSPVIPSLPLAGNNGVKGESADVVRTERPDSREGEKQDSRRYERQERSFERQGSHRLDRQESNRGDRGPDNKWDLDKDNQWDRERLDGRRKRDLDRQQDSRRDADSHRDIDKQESWRRPAESPVTIPSRNPNLTVSSLIDPLPRTPGRYSYSPTASAVELAQAFSRSSSIGSIMTGPSRGPGNLRSPLSPIPKASVHGLGAGYGNGIASPLTSRDTPFSRLAEASMPFSANAMEVHSQVRGFGESQPNYYGSGKLGGYGSGDLNRIPSTARDLHDESDDFPGKRGLPVRQKEGYYD